MEQLLWYFKGPFFSSVYHCPLYLYGEQFGHSEFHLLCFLEKKKIIKVSTVQYKLQYVKPKLCTLPKHHNSSDYMLMSTTLLWGQYLPACWQFKNQNEKLAAALHDETNLADTPFFPSVEYQYKKEGPLHCVSECLPA